MDGDTALRRHFPASRENGREHDVKTHGRDEARGRCARAAVGSCLGAWDACMHQRERPRPLRQCSYSKTNEAARNQGETQLDSPDTVSVERAGRQRRRAKRRKKKSTQAKTASLDAGSGRPAWPAAQGCAESGILCIEMSCMEPRPAKGRKERTKKHVWQEPPQKTHKGKLRPVLFPRRRLEARGSRLEVLVGLVSPARSGKRGRSFCRLRRNNVRRATSAPSPS